MAKTGPKQKPTALSNTRNRRGVADPTAPPPEVAADPVALQAWRETIDRLRDLELWHRADAAVVARYSLLASQWEACRRDVAEHGLVERTRTGYRCISPTAAQMNKISTNLLVLETALGFTPKARARMRVAVPDNGDGLLDRFIRGEKLTPAELKRLGEDD